MTTPALAADTKHGRVYDIPDVGQFFSITTFLHALNKEWLAAGARKVVADLVIDFLPKYFDLAYKDRTYAKKILKQDAKKLWDDRADVGSAVHAWIEQWCACVLEDRDALPAPDADPIAPYVKQFCLWVVETKPVVLQSETTVFNRYHRYAGTLDMITDWGLIDFKTGTDIYPDTVALQLAALRYAEAMVVGDRHEPMLDVEHCGVLHLTPDRYELIEMRANIEAFDAFLAVKHAWEWQTFGALEEVVDGKD